MTSTKCRVVIASRREGEGEWKEGCGVRFRNVSCQLLEVEGGYLNLLLLLLTSHIKDMSYVGEMF